MDFLKYNEYLLEKQIYDLLLESKVVFSKKFLHLLQSIVKLSPQNKIAPKLIEIYSKDYDVVQNYIDLTDEKDSVTFTPDRKVKELLGDASKEEIYKVTNSGRYLTHSSSNNRIFDLLNYEKPDGEPWAPEVGVRGKVLGEVVSPVSSKIFVIFESEDGSKKTVLNKEAIELDGPSDDVIWNSSRTNIKIGRLTRALLRSAGIEFTDRDIEQFTNAFKSTFDYLSDKLKQFSLVKGEKIKYWYWHEKYESGRGTMNNSCMAEVDEDYFDIYSNNSNCSLLILYSDDGQVTEEGYKSSTIKGRALVWNCEVNGQKETFMDRIYTVRDSDVDLFKQYATSKGWWHKKFQDMDQECDLVRGSESKSQPTIVVHLEQSRCNQYPYCDTLSYVYLSDNIMCNSPELDDESADRNLRDTGGEWE
jgi:hypothetical protein